MNYPHKERCRGRPLRVAQVFCHMKFGGAWDERLLNQVQNHDNVYQVNIYRRRTGEWGRLFGDETCRPGSSGTQSTSYYVVLTT
jgi:hypothetical protein